MSATAEMPYFINASKNLTAIEKKEAYEQATNAINANLDAETNLILKMSTINCLLKTFLPYFYWVGFYIVDDNKLKVGPYQGTLGCLTIDFSRGVCGKAAREEQTQIVSDVHAIEQGTAHIACDPNSQSEIVVPVFDNNKRLIAVLDVDSSLKNSFDEIDKMYLEAIVEKHFAQERWVQQYQF